MIRLTADELREAVAEPFGCGCYEKIFTFVSGPASFSMCWRCLHEDNNYFLNVYAAEIVEGYMECFVESEADYNSGNIYCDHCGRDLSAYVEESE